MELTSSRASAPSIGHKASPNAKSHLIEGAKALSQGDLDSAAFEFRSALAHEPRNTAALHNLGAIWLRSDDARTVSAAKTLFDIAIVFEPHKEQFRISRSTALVRLQRYPEAMREILDAIENIGSTERLTGALRQFKTRGIEPAKPLARLTAPPKNRIQRLDALANNGETDQLEKAAQLLCQQVPNFPRAWMHLFNVAATRNSLIEAEAYVLAVHALVPENPEAIAPLANTYRALGKPENALLVVEQALERIGPSIELFERAIEFATIDEDFPTAYKYAERAKTEFPDDYRSYTSLGAVLSAERLDEEAKNAFLAAIEAEPENQAPYRSAMAFFDLVNDTAAMEDVYNLALEHGVEFTDKRAIHVIARLEARKNQHEIAYQRLAPLYDPASDEKVNCHIAMTLGKIADKSGEYDVAFNAFVHGNRGAAIAARTRGEANPDRYSHRLNVYERLLEEAAKNPGMHAGDWRAPQDDPSVNFIVGFPRSGTTLLDTILRSHPAVEVFEEKPLSSVVARLAAIDSGLPQRTTHEQIQRNLFKTDREILRGHYFDQMRKFSETELNKELVYVDKLPLNLAFSNQLHYMFPEGNFIFAQRDPLDCVLSSFMQDFKINDAMFHMTNIITTAQLYDRVMRMWFKAVDVLGIDPVVVQYERLIEDHESQVRPVLDRLGIPWDERVTNYIETARSRGRISTPSAAQVIQPLYTSSRARWRRYREHLEPVIPILQPWREKLGYGPIDAD